LVQFFYYRSSVQFEFLNFFCIQVLFWFSSLKCGVLVSVCSVQVHFDSVTCCNWTEFIICGWLFYVYQNSLSHFWSHERDDCACRTCGELCGMLLFRSGMLDVVHMWNNEVEAFYNNQIVDQKRIYSQRFATVTTPFHLAF